MKSNKQVESSTETKYKALSQKVKTQVMHILKHSKKEMNSNQIPSSNYELPDSIREAKHIVNICTKILASEWKMTDLDSLH